MSGTLLSGALDISGDIDVDGHTNLDNTDIVGILTVTSTTQYGGYKLSNNSVVVGELVGLSGSNDTGALALWSGGSKYVQITSLGNSFLTGGSLGIGTITPNLNLHIHQNNSNASFAHFTNTSTGVNANQGVSFGLDSNEDATIYHYGSNNIRFATGGTEKVRIESGGGLKFTGQGTSIPVGGILHHTNNNLYVRGGTGGLILGNQDNTTTVQVFNGYIKFETNDGSEKLRIRSDGHVTIGTGAVSAAVSGGRALMISASDGSFFCVNSGYFDAFIVLFRNL